GDAGGTRPRPHRLRAPLPAGNRDLRRHGRGLPGHDRAACPRAAAPVLPRRQSPRPEEALTSKAPPARAQRWRCALAAEQVDGVRASSVNGADEEGGPHAAGSAEGDGPRPAAATAELEREGQGEPGGAHADRVTEGDGAAVDVDPVQRNAEVAGRGQAYRGEGLVDLDQALTPRAPSRRSVASRSR